MTIVKIEIDGNEDKLVIVAENKKMVHMDYYKNNSPISFPIKDLSKVIDTLMYVYNAETRYNKDKE